MDYSDCCAALHKNDARSTLPRRLGNGKRKGIHPKAGRERATWPPLAISRLLKSVQNMARLRIDEKHVSMNVPRLLQHVLLVISFRWDVQKLIYLKSVRLNPLRKGHLSAQPA